MRYLAEYILPAPAYAPKLGTATRIVREYKSDRTAIRYMHRHLAAPAMPSGQYRLVAWPAGTTQPERFVAYLYKTA